MNIYTLHKAGSFRPAPLESVAEIENIPSTNEKLPRPNLQVVTDENKINGSTYVTSETRGSEHSSQSEKSEKTTPRHNVTETFANNFANNVTQNAGQSVRVSASRIDATGVITETNNPQLMMSKAGLNNETMVRRKKSKAAAYSSSKMRKVKHVNLIHIQAKDEFMIFEDNTDLVSHITTPSAVRTSPLETDYLVIDHEEFAEEQSLFSAITVPKALRRKKNKKKSKTKSKSDGNTSEELTSKNDGNSTTVEEKLKIAPSVSYDDTEDEEEHKENDEEEKEPRQQVSPPKPLRSNSLDKQKAQKNSMHSSSQSDNKSKGSDLRGGKRSQASTPTHLLDTEEKSSSFPENTEEKDVASQDRSTVSNHQEEVENETKQGEVVDEKCESQEEQKKEVPDQKASPATSKEESNSQISSSVDQVESTEKAREKRSPPKMHEVKATETAAEKRRTPQVQKVGASKTSPEKQRPQQGQKMGTPKTTPEKQRSPQELKKNSDKSPELEGVKKYTSSAKKSPLKDGMSYAANAAIDMLDVTAQTVMDSTGRRSAEGSSNEGSSREDSNKGMETVAKVQKVPNSRKKAKSVAMLCLPTSYFCNRRRRNQEEEFDTEVEN